MRGGALELASRVGGTRLEGSGSVTLCEILDLGFQAVVRTT